MGSGQILHPFGPIFTTQFLKKNQLFQLDALLSEIHSISVKAM